MASPRPTRADLLRARDMLKQRMAGASNVRAVGLGLRRRNGQIRAGPEGGQSCVKIFVGRKLQRPAIVAPKWLRVPSSRGGHVRVYCDVESMGRPQQHSVPQFEHSIPTRRLSPPGSPGFLLRIRNSPRRLLVTAGHALLRRGTHDSPIQPDAFRLRPTDSNTGTLVGDSLPPLTYRSTMLLGGRLDAGGVEVRDSLTDAEVGLLWEAPPPISGYVTDDQLGQLLADEIPVTFTVYGHNQDPFDAQLTGLIDESTSFKFSSGEEVYAPVLIQSEELETRGRFVRGMSGAPLVDGAGDLLGIHVVGRGQNSSISWAVSAETILRAYTSELQALGWMTDPSELYVSQFA